ncbi:YybH family protein [Gordonia neofelifaecis]|uniref:DUF4440 domain-containing protein n=1 Tax=Gordonia neofelifaecis NRRL B-59395 TaxID=644548 RepID=F1YNP9_9ACTN|nr:SgcJ/EcaC family oxidoreductase [Gordonia neofelifaecis]EGD53656.1 hypothetical protein SCNU_17727 [Gordonia neofelifaecis NRRL B-59395]
MNTEPVHEMPAERAESISAADRDALRAIVADVERGFNTNDPDLMNKHVADDAVIVNAVGSVLRGRSEIDEAARAALANGVLREANAHYRLSDIASVAPDVAVAQKSAWSTPEAADSGQAPEMNALYVFVKRGGRWWIARRQNTLVPR